MNAIGDTGKFMQRARATWKRGQSHPLRLCTQILIDDYVEPYVNPGYCLGSFYISDKQTR